jgi:hypothetical protein
MNTFSFQFKRSIYSPVDLYDLCKRLYNAAGHKVSQDKNGELVANALKDSFGTLNEATEREKASPFTAQIHEMDSVRDNELLRIRDLIKSNTHHVKDSEKSNAADELLKVFNQHIGNVSKLGLGEETKAVSYLVESLMSSENRTKCELLGLVPLIEDLSQTQNALEALYVERSRFETEPGQDTIRNAMLQAANAVHRFLGYVDVLVAANGEGAAGLRNEVRSIIADVETIARARRTRLQQSGEQETGQAANQAA